MGRSSNIADILRGELGADPRLKKFAERLSKRLGAPDRNDEARARALVRELVLALQAALLIKNAPAAVADAFCTSRLGDEGGAVFGLLSRGADLHAIVERAAPVS